MKSESDIVNSILAGLPIPGHAGQKISTDQTKIQYNVNAVIINGPVRGNISPTGSTVNTTINIELRDCTLHLQGAINSLKEDLEKAGSTDAAAYLGGVYGTLNEMETTIETTQEQEAAGKAIVKKGIFSKLRNLYEDLMDEESDLHKKTSKLRNGAKKIQDMLGYYDAVAQWIPGAPRVPEAVLKIGKK